VNDSTPGTPDTIGGQYWFAVGPGLRPSIQEYEGGKFILTFEYLSHLFTRVFDESASWPPTQVNPVLVSGGPNPPTAYQYTVDLAQDSLTLKTQTSLPFGLVQQFLNPPILLQPVIYDNPTTIPPTFSATLTLAPGYNPQVPPGYTPYYRLYRRTFTPTIGPWTLLPISPSTNNWQAGSLSYTDSNPSSLRFQYSATLGVGFNYQDQWNPNAHEESLVGQTYITVDSTVGHLSFQLFLDESVTLDRTSYTAYSQFDRRSLFIVETANDEIQLSKSLLGQGGQAFAQFFTRGLFITAPNSSDELVFPLAGGVSNFAENTFALSAYLGA
jgi:hypothetical protein